MRFDRRGRRALAAVALALAPGCTLAEVSTPEGAERVVVEAVLRTDLAAQRVALHRSLGGDTSLAVPDASVEVVAPGGQVIGFGLAPSPAPCLNLRDTVTVEGRPARVSCYVSSGRGDEGREFWVRPGESYELRIRLADGGRIRGRTQVPGDFTLRSLNPRVWPPGARTGECRIPSATPLELVWSRAAGAWSYLADVRIFGLREALQDLGLARIPDPLELTGLSISESDTTLVLPGELGVFERFDYDRALLLALQNGLPAGVFAHVTIAAADRNYVNAVRGGSFNPSGNVRISSVVGDGVGVFGALNTLTLGVHVADEAGFPACRPR